MALSNNSRLAFAPAMVSISQIMISVVANEKFLPKPFCQVQVLRTAYWCCGQLSAPVGCAGSECVGECGCMRISVCFIHFLNNYSKSNKINNFEIEETVSAWNEIKSETGFCEKYLYIDWDFAKSMNNNPQFLQILSLYNITSPILSLSLPILVLIVPFFIIKLKGIELNMREYTDILRGLISEHAITKIFTSFHEVDTGQKIYLLISAALYMLSIYQNIHLYTFKIVIRKWHLLMAL